MAVQFGVLGAVEAQAGGRPVPLGHARQQCVLVALLVDANTPVPAGRLADRVWGDDLPQRAQGTLHSYISRLRQILADSGGVGIARQCGGYVLTVDPLAIDLQHFAQLLAQARASRDDEQAQILFDRALGLWRGDAFAGLDTAWLNSVRYTLHQQRFAAELDHADVRLRRGQHAALLAELSGRASTYPLDERVSGQLMLALHRSGRTGDALAQYQVSRRQLAEDLGIDPGPELQRLHREILAGDAPAGSRQSRTRSARSSPGAPGCRSPWPSPPRAARPAPVSRSPGWPGSCATPRAGWMHSMPVTRPPTCGPCSPGPTAP